MRQITVGDLLEKRIETAPFDQLIYLVHLERLVFYVGQSKRNVVTRFLEHLNKPSKLGQLIALNSPHSHRWGVRFFTLTECRPFVQQKRLFQDQGWEHFNMDMAEQALIAHFCPVVNSDFNPSPTPLPSSFNGRHLFTPPSIVDTAMKNETIWLNNMHLGGWVKIEDRHGRSFWKHRDGRLLTDQQIDPYRLAGKLPPT